MNTLDHVINRHMEELEKLRNYEDNDHEDHTNHDDRDPELIKKEYQIRLHMLKRSYNYLDFPDNIDDLSLESSKSIYSSILNDIYEDKHRYRFTYDDVVKLSEFILNNLHTIDFSGMYEAVPNIYHQYLDMLRDQNISSGIDEMSDEMSDEMKRHFDTFIDYINKSLVLAYKTGNLNESDRKTMEHLLNGLVLINVAGCSVM